MSEKIIARLDELKQGQEGLREDVGLVRQGQEGLRLGQEGLQQDVRLLRQGQGDLRKGQDDLREALAVLRNDQAEMHKGILRAIGESNENVLEALEALDVSVRDHRVRIEKLERKVG